MRVQHKLSIASIWFTIQALGYTHEPSSCLSLVDGKKNDATCWLRWINRKDQQQAQRIYTYLYRGISNWKHSNWVRNFSFKMTTIQIHTFTRIFIVPMKMLRVQFRAGDSTFYERDSSNKPWIFANNFKFKFIFALKSIKTKIKCSSIICDDDLSQNWFFTIYT